MTDNLRHAQYDVQGKQIDDPQELFPGVRYNHAAIGKLLSGALVCSWGSQGALSTTGSTGTGFSFTLDTTTLDQWGNPSVKCTFPSDATAQTFIGIWTPTNPIRLRDLQTLQIPLKYTSIDSTNGGIAQSATPLQIWLNTSSGKSIRIQLAIGGNGALGGPGVWHTYSVSRGAALITGTGSFADLDTANETITSVRIVQATTGAAANTNPVWLGGIRADTRRLPGRVSIVMDGEYSSQYNIIHQLLKANDLRVSLAVTTADIGGSGRMTAQQLDELYRFGHEIIHHTFDSTKTAGYVSAADWASSAAISEDIRAQWSYFRARGWTRGIGFGVWGGAKTFVSSTTLARQNLVRDGLRNGGLIAIRSSVPFNEPKNVLQPLCQMPIDPMVITGAVQVTSTDTAAALMAIVDAAEATGQWAIITLHRAVASAPGSLETTPGILQTLFQYIADRQAAGGIVNAPFGETYMAMFGDKFQP